MLPQENGDWGYLGAAPTMLFAVESGHHTEQCFTAWFGEVDGREGAVI
jgi:hypothetical protein